MNSIPAQTGTFQAWILDVNRWGDTQQMRTLAEATPGLDYELLSLSPLRGRPPKLRRVPRHSIRWLHPNSRALLRPPWPDVVFLGGRHAVSVALWIRRQHPRTRLVAFGRPCAPLHLFDLVLSNVVYLPPDLPNVLRLRAPLHVLDEQRLSAAKKTWRPRLRDLPRPYIALLVGGTSAPFRFSPDEAARLGREASGLASRLGGSLLVTTNNRVSVESTRALFNAVSVPAFLHDCREKGENPYLGFLALSDAMVVTLDSLSMMTEAAGTGVPVLIFPLEEERNLLRDGIDRLYDASMNRASLRWMHALLRRIEAQGILLRRADRKRFAEWLVGEGHARWFSPDPAVLAGPEQPRRLDMKGELERAVERLRSILHEAPRGGAG